MLLVLAACGTPPAPLTGHATTPSTRELAGYPGVVEPAEVACTFEGPWEYGQPDELRFRAGGPVFAVITQLETAHLELSGATAFVEIDAPAFRVWGFVVRAAVQLHAARAILFADYLVPGPYAVLHPIDAKPREVAVEIVPPKYLTPVAAARDVRACSDLSLAVGTFNPRTAIDGDRQTNDALPAGVAILLSTSPDARPIAELRFENETPVDVLERKGTAARVVLDPYGDHTADTFVVGWIPQSMLIPGPNGYGLNGARGGGRGGRRGRPRGTRNVQCSYDVQLIVELGAERHLVGAIKPGVVITVLAETADTAEIAFSGAGLQIAEGARAFARLDKLRDCTAATL